MPTSTRSRARTRHRPPPNRLLDLYESSALVGYAYESFRKMRPGKPGWVHTAPPFVKVGGRCMIYRDELAAWAKSHDIPMRDELAA
jgi:predicted DNA-binding transcriptional regulator AlpA